MRHLALDKWSRFELVHEVVNLLNEIESIIAYSSLDVFLNVVLC